MTNLLLTPTLSWTNVDFKDVTPGHFKEAIEILIPQVRAEHEATVTGNALTFEALFEQDPKRRQLDQISVMLSHLVNVVDNPDLRQVYTDCMPQISVMSQELGLDERAYQQVVAFSQTDAFTQLNPIQAKITTKVIRNYEREGIHLAPAIKERLGQIAARLVELGQIFDCNLSDFTGEATLKFDLADLAGVPERTIQNSTLLPSGQIEITMISGGFDTIATHADSASARQAVYESALSLGVQRGRDNRPVLVEIAALSQEHARILGYPSYAHYAIEDKMAATPESAIAFTRNLAERCIVRAKQETSALIAFGTQFLDRPPVFADFGYIGNKMRKDRFSVDPEAMRKYFPVDKALKGLFQLLEDLYALQFIENTVRSTWHEDVQVYDIIDKTTHSRRGTLYMDLFKRKDKSDGAWMHPVRTRHKGQHEEHLPETIIVCNIPKNLANVSTFSFGELVTLFHEMGHALHNTLTDVTEEYFSGLCNVEHDAIEFPSQFMENFCWDYEVLKLLSSHVDTGEVLPLADFNNLKESKLFMAAGSLLSMTRYSLVDLMIYSNPLAVPADVEKEVYDEWKTRESDIRDEVLPSFTHIFSGGYAAGCYAYLWSEMLSTDAFAALSEQGATYHSQQEAAINFRNQILAVGGVASMADNFRAFRGRDPDLAPLLASYNC